MNTKTLFAGGSFISPKFHIVSKDSLISKISSLKEILKFAKALGFSYYTTDDLLIDISSQEEYMDQNVDLKFIQSEILKAFDNNSSFYFKLEVEGSCEFIAFGEELTQL